MHFIHHIIRHRQHSQQPRPPLHHRGGRPCLQTSQNFHRPRPRQPCCFFSQAQPRHRPPYLMGPLQRLLETRDPQQLLENSQCLRHLQKGSPIRPLLIPHHFYHQHPHPHL